MCRQAPPRGIAKAVDQRTRTAATMGILICLLWTSATSSRKRDLIGHPKRQSVCTYIGLCAPKERIIDLQLWQKDKATKVPKRLTFVGLRPVACLPRPRTLPRGGRFRLTTPILIKKIHASYQRQSL